MALSSKETKMINLTKILRDNVQQSDSITKAINYRAIIKAAWDTRPPTEEHDQQLIIFSWAGIEKHMAGERWPPTSEDWKEYAGLDWSEIPKQKALQQIEDTDIRYATYFYSEIAEHTERIKATAAFSTLTGADTAFFNNSVLFMAGTVSEQVDHRKQLSYSPRSMIAELQSYSLDLPEQRVLAFALRRISS
jgi:hypothetical protein